MSTSTPTQISYHTTSRQLRITRHAQPVDGARELASLRSALDSHRGVLLTSGYDYPGRYTRWDVGFCDPPLALEGRERSFRVHALNERGRVLLPLIGRALSGASEIEHAERNGSRLELLLAKPAELESEELRTRRPSALSIVRLLRELFGSCEEPHLGLYGAFGYDLVFALDALSMRRTRPAGQRDLVLYLPDALLVVDHQRGTAMRYSYDFEFDGKSTQGLARDGASQAFCGPREPSQARDHAPGEFAQLVQRARERFARGELFEVTPSQVFRTACTQPPSQLFERLCEQNPAPYGFLLNLGEQEYLVGASPEMYVRVEGQRVETCPIAGTIARGSDALEDAAQIQKLLRSPKDESELTMCTDVDRNDKARVCEPGSVRVIGRRQIELYSRLIHTVDHVEGRLREGYDGLDAFMTHLWAVTVTGAPKLAAMQFIEDQERSPRRFYAGAVGRVGFDGHINTGLTLRALRIDHGVAEVRAGATLLFESDPVEEERECELKASALRGLLSEAAPASAAPPPAEASARRPGAGKRLLLVDHEDSFVHTLADYFRQTGAEVITLRHDVAAARLAALSPDLCVLSPGPGRPSDFATSALLGRLIERGIAVFGVCLGLQAIVEHFGGRLSTLPTPAHGKASRVRVLGGRLFAGLPDTLTVGRYHSLYAEDATFPGALRVTARLAGDDAAPVMALEHRTLPLSAVQFHPESILSAHDGLGLRLTENALAAAVSAQAPQRVA